MSGLLNTLSSSMPLGSGSVKMGGKRRGRKSAKKSRKSTMGGKRGKKSRKSRK
jgi:hypothetical protein